MNYRQIIGIALCAAIATSLTNTLGAADKDEVYVNLPKQHYIFKQFDTPDELLACGCGVYAVTGNIVQTLNGYMMAKLGEKIIDARFNPSGYNFVLLAKTKDDAKAQVFNPLEAGKRTYNYNAKTYGNPTAVLFSCDGRRLLIASDKCINVFDAVNFDHVKAINVDYTPVIMEMSANGNFLAYTDGHRATVLNYKSEQPRLNRVIDGVVDMKFSDDSSEFAALTDDGTLQIFDTRSFAIKNTIDDLDGGIAFDYNFDGKYVAIATAPDKIVIINLLNPTDREVMDIDTAHVNDVIFLPDNLGQPQLVFTTENAVRAERMNRLSPYFGKLVAEEASQQLDDWLKMMPGETMEQYNMRVNDATRREAMHRFENEISTRYAGDLVSMASVSLGSYDRANESVKVNFSNMPSIMLSVPEGELQAFTDVDNLEFRNAMYGLTSDDQFELIYAEIYNSANGHTYTYDNLDRVMLQTLDDDTMVSLDVIQKQQMEDVRLQEIRHQIIEDAKQENLISDHTHITVDSHIDTDYDADGRRQVNYVVKFSYEVEPEYILTEDFGPGKYVVEESPAASAMLKIVKEALEGELANYIKQGKTLRVTLIGTADAMPINGVIAYKGQYGEYEGEPVYQNGQLNNISVNRRKGIRENEQLAFVRALGVKDYIEKNIDGLDIMNTDYQYNIEVSQEKGGQYRRITAEFIFVDAF